MNCENCGAPTTPVEGRNYSMCGYCHTFRFPTQLLDSDDRITPLCERADLACPVCGDALEAGAFDSVRMLYCRRCRGVLIPNQAFAKVVRNRRRNFTGCDDSPVPLDMRQYQRQLFCPHCAGRMEVHPYHGPGNVIIDSCVGCHLIWLDHGELAAIERAPGTRQPEVSSRVPLPSPAPAPSAEPRRGEVNLFQLLFG